MRYILLFTLCSLLPMSAMAETSSPAGTRINLSATSSMHVPNDELVINFRVEKEGIDVRAIRNNVNKITNAIQTRLKHETGVQFKTLSRSMQPVWKNSPNQPRRRTGWRMLQTGKIISQKLASVPAWLDAIESSGAHLSSLQFRLSVETASKQQDQLRLQAIALFKKKAAVITQGLGGKSFRVMRLNTTSQAPRPRVYQSEMAMMARSSAAHAPSLAAGEGKLSVTVSGEIETGFIDFPSHQ